MVEPREAMQLRNTSAMAQYFTMSSWGLSWHTLVNWVEASLQRFMQEETLEERDMFTGDSVQKDACG